MADQDWFAQNAPKQATESAVEQQTQAPATSKTAPAPVDWFAQNAPAASTAPAGPGNQPTQPAALPLRFPQMLRDAALEYAPTIGATIGTAMVPEAGIPLRLAMAALGGAGGSTAQQVVEKAGGLPGAPQSGTEFLKRAGTDAAVQAGGEFGGQAINKVLGQIFKRITPTQMYQSALRPQPSKGTAEIGRMVEGGLSEGVPVSEAGKGVAEQKWRELMGQVGDIVNADPNRPIDRTKVLAGLNDIRQRWTSGSGDPAFLKAINEVERNFTLRHPNLTGAGAQEAKKGIYEEIRLQNKNAFTSEGPNALSTQAKQEIANGLKQELEIAYPGIKELNKKAGAMIELERAMDRAVAREGNLRITPYFAPVLAGIAAGSQHGVEGAGLGAVIGGLGTHLMRAVFEDPEVKSKLAIALAKASQSKVIKVGQLASKYLSPTQTAVRGAGNLVQNVLAPPPSQTTPQ